MAFQALLFVFMLQYLISTKLQRYSYMRPPSQWRSISSRLHSTAKNLHFISRNVSTLLPSQSMDYTSIYFTVKELQDMVPARLDNIYQDDSHNLYMCFKSSLKSTWLHFSWCPVSSWFTLTSPPSKSRSNRFSFESTLSSFIHEYALTKLSVADNCNRIIYLDFSEKLSQKPRYRLYFEMLGVRANIVLVDLLTNKILTAGRQVTVKSENKLTLSNNRPVKLSRAVQIGLPYISPRQEFSFPLISASTPKLSSFASVIDSLNYDQFKSTVSRQSNRTESAVHESSLCHSYDYLSVSEKLLMLSPGLSPNVVYSMLLSHNNYVQGNAAPNARDQFSLTGSHQDLCATSPSDPILDLATGIDLSESNLQILFQLYKLWYDCIMIPAQQIMQRIEIPDHYSCSSWRTVEFPGSKECIEVRMTIRPHLIAVKNGALKNGRSHFFSPLQFEVSKSNDFSDFNVMDQHSISTQVPVSEYLRLYYLSNYRLFQFNFLKHECEKLMSVRLRKALTLHSRYQREFIQASNGKADALRYKADLITSYIHTARQVKTVYSDKDKDPSFVVSDTRAVQGYESQFQAIKESQANLYSLLPTSDVYRTENNMHQPQFHPLPNSNIPIAVLPNPPKVQTKPLMMPDVYKPTYIVDCVDFATQELVSMRIDNGMSPNEYVQDLYRKSKKASRSISKLQSLLQQATVHLEYLTEIEGSLNRLVSYSSYNDILTLKEILSELTGLQHVAVATLNGQPSSQKADDRDSKTKSRAFSSTSYKQQSGKAKFQSAKLQTAQSNHRASDNKPSSLSTPSTAVLPSISKKKLAGLLVLNPSSNLARSSPSIIDSGVDWKLVPPLVVGRNSLQNERVTFDLAKDHHLWFHVSGSPGSHCLLLLDQGADARDDAIQFAADVASYFSQMRGGTQVPVGFCSPKHIRKPPGGKLGLVSVLQSKGTVYGRPDRGEIYVRVFGPTDI